jgi:hypothetical protein
MNHFILYNNIKNLTVATLVELILANEKKLIGELKFVDLIYKKQSMIGVYLIFDSANKPAYIGKTGSRAILERMAAHFDLRQGAFMNSFLCALAGKKKSRKGIQATEEDIKKIYNKSLKYKIVFIQILDKDIITRLESILLRELVPPLNSIRGKRAYDLTTLIKNI